MRRTVYIRLQAPGADAAATWLVRDPSADIGSVVTGRLSDALAQLDDTDRVAVILPGAEALVSTVDLPIRQRGRLMQAVPFAMEEQLADDVDSFHFAVGARASDGTHTVIAINHDRLSDYLAPMIEADRDPDVAYLDCQMLPTPDAETGTVLVEDSAVLVRTQSLCAALDRDLIDMLPAQLGDDATPPACYAAGGADFSPGLLGASEMTPVADTLSALVAWIDHARPVNLLQGQFRPRDDASDWWRPWMPAAAMVAVLAVLGAVYQAADLASLNAQATQMEQANLARFQTLFPAEQRIVDIRTQLAQQMASLREGDGQAGLLYLLDQTRRAFGDDPGFTLRELQYRGNNLFVSLSGDDLQALEALRERFAAQPGVALEVESANATGDGVKVRLKVSPA